MLNRLYLRIKKWNVWRKQTTYKYSKLYELCVLLGVSHSPTFERMMDSKKAVVS